MKQSEQINELATALSKAQGESNILLESKLLPKLVNLIKGPPKRFNQNNYPGIWKAFLNKICSGSSNCWYWRGSINHLGYGCFNGDRAHRFSYKYFKGQITKGLSVLHTCDIRNCVNPDHLFLGTQIDNMRDAINKGRFIMPPRSKGEKSPVSKFSEKIVLEIREKYQSGKFSQHSLAREYNMSVMNVNRIVRRILWSHI